MQDVPADISGEVASVDIAIPVQPMLSPTLLRTPTNAMSLVALQQMLEVRQEATMDIDPYLQKLLNAAKQAIAGKELLEVRCGDLMKQNSEKRTRQHVKERKVGDAKIMGYEEIVEALMVRDRKEAESKRKADCRATNKAKTTAKHMVDNVPEGEVAEMSSYCSIFPVEPAGPIDDTRHSDRAMDISTSDSWPVDSEGGEEIPWQAPVARMY